MKKLSFALFLLIGLIAQGNLYSQSSEETKAEVIELKAFHEVIFRLWHDAWPNKDVAALTAMIPDIDSHVDKIQKVELPGILRDKKPKWEESVKSLSEVVADYKKAIASKDTQKILDAAEKLHSQYESMVRILRPGLKEIDTFHQSLYTLYHYYMPEYNKEKIKEAVNELLTKMDTLNQATLSERMKSKERAFNTKRAELDKSVRHLAKVIEKIDDRKAVKNAINAMHTKYQALEKVFE